MSGLIVGKLYRARAFDGAPDDLLALRWEAIGPRSLVCRGTAVDGTACTGSFTGEVRADVWELAK